MEWGPTLWRKEGQFFLDMNAEYFNNTMAITESDNSVEQVEQQKAGQGTSTPAPPKKLETQGQVEMGPQEGRKKTRRGGRKRRRRGILFLQTPDAEELINVINVSQRVLTHSCLKVWTFVHHFYIFGTLLDINRFIRNINIRKHYLSSDVDIQDCVDINTLHNDVSECFSFQEYCSIKDLTDLAAEGDDTGLIGDVINEGIGGLKLRTIQIFIQLIHVLREWIDSRNEWREIWYIWLPLHILLGTHFENLTMDERSALRDLQDDSSIVIRNSDKSGLVVVII